MPDREQILNRAGQLAAVPGSLDNHVTRDQGWTGADYGAEFFLVKRRGVNRECWDLMVMGAEDAIWKIEEDFSEVFGKPLPIYTASRNKTSFIWSIDHSL